MSVMLLSVNVQSMLQLGDVFVRSRLSQRW